MSLEITRNGIVSRRDDGSVFLHIPGKNGGIGLRVEVETALAEAGRLATGDVVVGITEPIPDAEQIGGERVEAHDREEQWDEPGEVRGETGPARPAPDAAPTRRLVSLERINGLSLSEAEERPFPRRRNALERSAPDRLVTLATGASDVTGRALDFAAPLGLGYAGVIYGPHAGGLTRTLRAVVSGVAADAPECLPIVLLLRARGEEVTDWRRQFPEADIVVCPSPQEGATAEQTLHMANLALQCALRQTELGRDVLLAVDSLTGLWGAMLEAEAADAQAEADQAGARQGIREWVQKAGCFHGEGLLGSGLGGSLTLLGTVWQQPIDLEAEEEREVHPHLRLLEHILHETSWRVPLSAALAERQLYPAIDTARCLSQSEEDLLSPAACERLFAARRALSGLPPEERYLRLMEALETTRDAADFLGALSGGL